MSNDEAEKLIRAIVRDELRKVVVPLLKRIDELDRRIDALHERGVDCGVWDNE
jgi:hypothetical protein